MARRIEDQKFPCELLVEKLIGQPPLTVPMIFMSDLPTQCGYTGEGVLLKNSIYAAINMLHKEGVLVMSKVDVDRVGPYSRVITHHDKAYVINPLLAGVTDGKLMRELMKERTDAPIVRASTPVNTSETKAWASVFKAMGNKQPA